MTLKGRFEYEKALVLTPERIRELEKIFLEYCKNISYKATTVTDTEIIFSSVDELLDYDNYYSRRIKSLTVTGKDGLDEIVSCIFGADGLEVFSGYSKTCICKYTTSTVEMEKSLRDRILEFLKKSTAQYWLIGKIRIFGILTFASGIALGYIWLGGTHSDSEINIPVSIFLGTIIIACALLSLVRLIDRHGLKKIFPAVAFAWGEEAKSYERFERIRHNLFWAVIVAIIVGIAAAFIKDMIPLNLG